MKCLSSDSASVRFCKISYHPRQQSLQSKASWHCLPFLPCFTFSLLFPQDDFLNELPAKNPVSWALLSRKIAEARGKPFVRKPNVEDRYNDIHTALVQAEQPSSSSQYRLTSPQKKLLQWSWIKSLLFLF